MQHALGRGSQDESKDFDNLVGLELKQSGATCPYRNCQELRSHQRKKLIMTVVLLPGNHCNTRVWTNERLKLCVLCNVNRRSRKHNFVLRIMQTILEAI